MGSKLILKDRGASLPTYEVPNIQFVQEQTSIPVPAVVDSWKEGDPTLILMRRISGEPLSQAWSKLSTDEKDRIAKQTAEYLQQLRKLQSDNIQSLGGRPVFPTSCSKIRILSSPTVPCHPTMISGVTWNIG